MGAFGVLVGGGPAPGINGVISAAVIEAINRGHSVFGIENGFSLLMKGDTSRVRTLTISDVSRIHREGGSVLGTSRANPAKSQETLNAVVAALESLGISHLVTIGGDDTASSAHAVSRAAAGRIRVAHVPKTIDNDLPLPEKYSTFGFQTACEVGTQIVETLMVDARTTKRWYFVVAMGRKAGHQALGIGIASGATLTVIPEQIGDQRISLQLLADVLVGSFVKRLVTGRSYGVAVLAEGLAEKLDPASIPELANAERDPHGHIRYVELDFAGMIKRAVRARLESLGLAKITIVEKNVGYELRCVRPNSFDREYTRMLGYGAVDFLASGGSEAMITRRRDELVPLPFSEMTDPESGRALVRYVDTNSTIFKVASKYMRELTVADLENRDFTERASKLLGLSPEDFRREFLPAAQFVSNKSGRRS